MYNNIKTLINIKTFNIKPSNNKFCKGLYLSTVSLLSNTLHIPDLSSVELGILSTFGLACL